MHFVSSENEVALFVMTCYYKFSFGCEGLFTMDCLVSMKVVHLSVFDFLGRASYPLLVDAQTTPFYCQK